MENPFTEQTVDEFDLTADQKKVLSLITVRGTEALSIRDKAKMAGVANPLNEIRTLVDLGFIVKGKTRDGKVVYKKIR